MVIKSILLLLSLALLLSVPALADVAIDGSATVSSTNSISLTTTKSHDVIVVLSVNSTSTATISSISDGKSLTWNKRKTLAQTGLTIEEWYAVSPGRLSSDLVTITYSAGTGGRLVVFGVSGENVSTPFDTNAALPASVADLAGQAATVSISTTNANDLCFTFLRSLSSLGIVTSPSGYAQFISAGANQENDSDVYYATQLSQAIDYSWTGVAAVNSLIVDCVQAATPNGLLSTAF